MRRSGAGEGIRTLDINLGKVALYQLSYARLKMVLVDCSKSGFPSSEVS